MRILIVEGDAELAAAMAEYLERQGADCDFAYKGTACLAMTRKVTFDVVILNLILPKMSGLDVCKQLRRYGIQTPVLMLTDIGSHADQLEGFRAGVDDYVLKPCPMPLLWARLQALYRRNNPEIDAVSIGSLTLYISEHRASREGKDIKPTPTGWKILELLARNSPNVVSRSEIEGYAWPEYEVDSGNFNVQLHQLRKAIDRPFSSPLIHTLVGVGLCLRVENVQTD